MRPFKRKSLAGELDSIMSLVINDEDLVKLIHYNEDNPFDLPNLTVKQKKDLIDTKIIKRKNMRILNNESGSYLTFRLNHFLPSVNNPNAVSHVVDFYVMCHNGSIDTEYGERDLLIVEALTRIFYLQNTVGQNKPKLVRIDDLVFNSNDFSGYLVTFEILNETLTQ